MVIGPNGEKMGIKKLEDALTLSKYAGLDLVLMNPGNTPAVGKIMDYNKYVYEKKKKLKEQQKHQRENTKELKEYRLSYNIDIGDFNTRKRNASEYLKKGHKVKGSIRFRGREMKYVEEGKKAIFIATDFSVDYAQLFTENDINYTRSGMIHEDWYSMYIYELSSD